MKFKSLNTYLTKNPKLLSAYINVSMTVIGAVLKPLDKVMKHALIVQGIDPNSSPGDREKQALLYALDENLTKVHEKDFDEDYNFSWAKKCLELTNKKLANLHLTKETYKNLTNLNHLDDVSQHETRLYPTTEEVESKLEEKSRPTKFVVHPDSKPMPEFDMPSFKQAVTGYNEDAAQKALQKLKKFADDFERAENIEEQMIAQNHLDEAGSELMQAKRNEYNKNLAAETRDAFNPVHARYPRVSAKPIKTHKRGLFERVNKKKD